MAKAGDVAGAQRIILAELEKQYAGQAAALAATAPGKMQQAWNSIGDAMESVGAVILPVLADIAGYVKSAADAFSNLSPETQRWVVIAGGIAAAAGPAIAVLGVMASSLSALTALMPALGAAASVAFGPIGIAAAAAAAAFLLLRDNVSAAEAATKQALGVYRSNIGALNDSAVASQGYSAALRNQIAMQVEAARSASIMANASLDSANARAQGFAKMTGLKFAPFEYNADVALAEANALDFALGGLEEQLKKVDANLKPVAVSTVAAGSAMTAAAGSAKKITDAWAGLREVSVKTVDTMSHAGEALASTFASTFQSVIEGSKSVREALTDLLKQLSSMLLNNAFKMLLSGGTGGGGGILGAIFGGLKLPEFANGGTMTIEGSLA